MNIAHYRAIRHTSYLLSHCQTVQYMSFAFPHHPGTEIEFRTSACIEMTALIQNAVVSVIKRHQVKT